MENELMNATENLPEVQVDPMVSMIEKVVLDPNADIDKLERVIALQEKMVNKQAETSFNRSMARAQAEMTPISTDATNPQTRSKYATYAQLDRALRPIYTNHGFALSFDEGETSKEGYVRVLCYVTHEDGFSRTYHKDMPVVSTGIKGNVMMTETHANASADSYGMRYLEKKIFNVAIGEADDDGNAAGGQVVECITEAQQATIQDMIDSNGLDMTLFKKKVKVVDLSEIHVNAFKSVIDLIKQAVKTKADEL